MINAQIKFAVVSRGPRFLLAIAIAWFVLMEFAPAIDVPEICNDEACVGASSLLFLRNEPQRDWFLIHGRYLPLSDGGHHGALEIYALAPFLFFGGAHLAALRVGPIIAGVVILMICYLLGRVLFNAFVGGFAALLLATNTSFIIFMKMGGYFGFTLPFFTLAPLLFLFLWHASRRSIFFYAGIFVLGLGLNVKGHYIWFIISLCIAELVFYARRFRHRAKMLLVGVCVFIAGALPVLSVYLHRDFHERFVIRGFLSEGGVNNLDIPKNISIRLGQAYQVLVGSLDGNNQHILEYDYRVSIVILFWACLLSLLYLLFVKKTTALSRRRVSFMVILTGMILACSTITLTSLHKGHLILLLPYLQLLMAMAVFELWRWPRHKLVAQGVSVMVASVLIGAAIFRCGQMYHSFKQEAASMQSCSLDMLAQWLVDQNAYEPVLFTPCMLEFSSDFRIRPMYLAWFLVDARPEIRQQLKDEIRQATSKDYFIFGLSADYDAYDAFQQYVHELKREVVINKQFFYNDGRVRFTICSVK